MEVLRTKKCLKRYHDKRKKLGKEFSNVDLTKLECVRRYFYWTLVKNEFPYDKITKRHDMLVPLRKFPKEGNMTMLEWCELMNIKKEIEKDYDSFLENTFHRRVLSNIFHLHCITYL